MKTKRNHSKYAPCPTCGNNRVLVQLREILGVPDGEDILKVARQLKQPIVAAS